MEQALKIVGAVAGVAIAITGWLRYQDYQIAHTDMAYHSQCPDPTYQYFDCDWWPKKR